MSLANNQTVHMSVCLRWGERL